MAVNDAATAAGASCVIAVVNLATAVVTADIAAALILLIVLSKVTTFFVRAPSFACIVPHMLLDLILVVSISLQKTDG